jgi:hypothetical protein
VNLASKRRKVKSDTLMKNLPLDNVPRALPEEVPPVSCFDLTKKEFKEKKLWLTIYCKSLLTFEIQLQPVLSSPERGLEPTKEFLNHSWLPTATCM